MLLQASAFFQDVYMVNLLCNMLGSRLLKVFPEAGTNTSDQQPATMQHIDQVCTRPSTYKNAHFTVKFMFWFCSLSRMCILVVTSRCVPWQRQVTHIATCLTWSIDGCAHRTSPVDGFFARAESITGWSASGILGVYVCYLRPIVHAAEALVLQSSVISYF